MPRRTDKPISLRRAPGPDSLPGSLDNWPAPADPVAYIEDQAGRYVAMYEGLMNWMVEHGQVGEASVLLLNLLKMTKVGRTKADLHVNPLGEVDLSHLKDDDLLRLVGGAAGEGG